MIGYNCQSNQAISLLFRGQTPDSKCYLRGVDKQVFIISSFVAYSIEQQRMYLRQPHLTSLQE